MAKEHKQELGRAAETMPEVEARMVVQAEKALHKQILDWLHMKGVKGVIRARMDRKSTLPVGVPDMLFSVKGVPVAIEVKVGKNQPSSEQKVWMADLKADGWMTGIVRSLDDVIQIYNMAVLYGSLFEVK